MSDIEKRIAEDPRWIQTLKDAELWRRTTGITEIWRGTTGPAEPDTWQDTIAFLWTEMRRIPMKVQYNAILKRVHDVVLTFLWACNLVAAFAVWYGIGTWQDAAPLMFIGAVTYFAHFGGRIGPPGPKGQRGQKGDKGETGETGMDGVDHGSGDGDPVVPFARQRNQS